MGNVLLLGVGIWLVGLGLRWPVALRAGLIGVLYLAVVAVQLTLPEGAPLRAMTGGSVQPWLVLGGVAVAIAGYVGLLRRLRRRARPAQTTAPTQQGPFSEAELERYARHITLREIGGVGQKRLKEAKVLVVGAGGLGAPVCLYLAGTGVGTIGVVDDDKVDLSNLARQVIHKDADLGMPKVFSAEAAMRALNPHIEVRPYNRRLTPDIAAELVAEYDLVLDGTDNFATRDLVNRACVAAKVPLLSGAISQWEGQISLFDPAKGAPCYACLFPNEPAAGLAPSCAEGGVAAPLPGVIGTMMALEAVKHLTRAGEGLRGRLMIYDALGAETRVMRIKRAPGCPVCGTPEV